VRFTLKQQVMPPRHAGGERNLLNWAAVEAATVNRGELDEPPACLCAGVVSFPSTSAKVLSQLPASLPCKDRIA